MPARVFAVVVKCCRQLGTFLLLALWDTPRMIRIQRRKADDFDEGRAAVSVLGETTSRFGHRFRVAVSPRGSIGKIRPSLSAYSGTQFPLETSVGKPIPF